MARKILFRTTSWTDFASRRFIILGGINNLKSFSLMSVEKVNAVTIPSGHNEGLKTEFEGFGCTFLIVTSLKNNRIYQNRLFDFSYCFLGIFYTNLILLKTLTRKLNAAIDRILRSICEFDFLISNQSHREQG